VFYNLDGWPYREKQHKILHQFTTGFVVLGLSVVRCNLRRTCVRESWESGRRNESNTRHVRTVPRKQPNTVTRTGRPSTREYDTQRCLVPEPTTVYYAYAPSLFQERTELVVVVWVGKDVHVGSGIAGHLPNLSLGVGGHLIPFQRRLHWTTSDYTANQIDIAIDRAIKRGYEFPTN
jgi:hypothetical protein